MKKLLSTGLIALFFVLPFSFVRAGESDERLDQLISSLENDPNWAGRSSAAFYLGEEYKGNEKAFQALIGALHDQHYGVRTRILEALGNHENPEAFSSIQKLLRWSYNPRLLSYLDGNDTYVIEEAMKTLGKIHNDAAPEFILDYFFAQADRLIDFPIGWDEVRSEALQSLLTLTQDDSQVRLKSLYEKHKDLLTATSVLLHEGQEIPKSKLAQEYALLFLKRLDDYPLLTTEIVSTMIHSWPTHRRLQFKERFLTQDALPALTTGLLDDQGKFIGRLGQFSLKDTSGEVICEIHVSPERLLEVYRFVGKEVVLTGEIRHQRGRSKLWPMVEDRNSFFLELTDIQLAQ